MTNIPLEAFCLQIERLEARIDDLEARVKPQSPWMTADEVRRYLGYKSLSSVRNLVHAGKLKKHFINGRARYSRAEVEKL